MSDIHDAETQAICPITSTHGANGQPRWNDQGMLGYRCSRCGEFSMGALAQVNLGHRPAGERERISQVLAAIWKNGHGAAAALDEDGLARVAAVPFVSTNDDPVERPHEGAVASLTELFRGKRQGQGLV